MGEQVAAGIKKKTRREPFEIERAWEHANLYQRGSAVEIRLVLPVIRVSEKSGILMADKTAGARH